MNHAPNWLINADWRFAAHCAPGNYFVAVDVNLN